MELLVDNNHEKEDGGRSFPILQVCQGKWFGPTKLLLNKKTSKGIAYKSLKMNSRKFTSSEGGLLILILSSNGDGDIHFFIQLSCKEAAIDWIKALS